MPSQQHESLLLLFKSRTTLAAESLIDHCAMSVSQAEARIGSATFADVQPAEYRADLVVYMLNKNGVPLLGIIVEMKYSCKRTKQSAVRGPRMQSTCMRA